MKKLKALRRVVAIIMLFAATMLFLDFTGTIHHYMGWVAKIQFLPALFALNFGVVVALVVLTLLFGRLYCSVICPLGITQDLISWLSTKRKKHRYHFGYTKNLTWLRYGMLGLFVLVFVLGVASVVALLDPYAAFGRIVNSLFQPIYQWCNNLLATWAEHSESYQFYTVDVWLKSLPTLIIAVVTLVVIIVLAWRGGRTYCNSICPVGTLLGTLSKYSLFRPTIDTTKCNGCGLCGKGCKAHCINSKEHEIDYSRCVTCFDCINNCNRGAITYKLRTKQQTAPQQTDEPDTTRRQVIATAAALTVTGLAEAQHKHTDGGLAIIEDKKIPNRKVRLVPPGGVSLWHFSKHCVGCQLCVAACPNGVLRPSNSLMNLMQPEMSYERGYCRPECTKCSEVCPAGAIHKLTAEVKASTQIGYAVWIKENCVNIHDGVMCDNCFRHCPSGAITMVHVDANNPASPMRPAINTERCIGCGACENLCPSRPLSAIYVEGNQQQRTL